MMRNLRFFPLTFLCGMPGFIYFVPWLLLCTAAVLVRRRS